jgi:hypothetical protein
MEAWAELRQLEQDRGTRAKQVAVGCPDFYASTTALPRSPTTADIFPFVLEGIRLAAVSDKPQGFEHATDIMLGRSGLPVYTRSIDAGTNTQTQIGRLQALINQWAALKS